MSLIICPECNNQVSTTTDICPHCGFNIKRIISYCPLCKDEKILMDYIMDKNELVCPKCGFGGKLSTPEQEVKWAEQRRIEEEQRAHQVKCPSCGCTDVKKISGTSKVASIAMFGLLSQKRKHQFKCLNPKCGFEW